MSGHPGSNKPDYGAVQHATAEQKHAATTYVQRHHFDDEADVLAMLGLDGAA